MNSINDIVIREYVARVEYAIWSYEQTSDLFYLKNAGKFISFLVKEMSHA